MTINIDTTHVILGCIAIYGVISSMFNKIRYECVKKASTLVATVEQDDKLTGEQKFSTVVLWIDESLPFIFKNTLVKNFLHYIVQYAYDNSQEYAQNYIKRKTGYDTSEVINKIKQFEDNQVTIEVLQELLEKNSK